MGKKIGKLLLILAFALIPTLLIWMPFFLRLDTVFGIPLPKNGMETIIANYDGPLYIVVAKTLYDPSAIASNYQFPLPTEYYAAHFPLFPLLIKMLGFVMNFPYAMLIVTVASSALAIFFFNKLASRFVDNKGAMFLTFVFAVFPARWLIVRSIGSADPLFVAGILASLYYFRDKKYWLSAIWGAVAVMTKSPGILLFAAYLLTFFINYITSKKAVHILKKAYPLLLIPLSLVLVFFFYKIRMNDFLAYFHSGDNIHLSFLPFQIFNYSAPWVGTFWLEEIIFIYLFGAIGVYRLIAKKEIELAAFTGIFYLVILFVAHRDILRYFLPAVPFLLIAFSDVLIKKEFKIALAVILIPIYLYSLAFISQNTMPISNWAPFL